VKVLVTGGAGFIGSHLVDRLVQLGYEVLMYDNLDPQVHPQKPGYLNPKAKLIQRDIRDYEALKGALKGCQLIFHLASVVGVGQSQYEIKRYVDVNIGGTANLLDILIRAEPPIKRLILASSMSIYGEGAYICQRCGRVRPDKTSPQGKGIDPACPLCSGPIRPVPVREDDPPQCNSIYAVTKMAQEEMVINFGKAYRVPTVALRLFNTYGPRQSLSNPYTGAVAIFISRVKNLKPPVLYEDGLQSRDFVCVHDVVKAFVSAAERPEVDLGVFNVGTGRACTVKELALLVIKAAKGEGLEPQITHTYRSGDIRHCFADISRIRNLLGYNPSIDLQEGIRELVEWSRTQTAVDLFDSAQQELKLRGLTHEGDR
jgi:dTDP-L-rhamnose 4-epimerase